MNQFKSRFSLSPEEMAHTYIYLSTSDEVLTSTGSYFDEQVRSVQPAKYAKQPQHIKQVMALTMRYINLELSN